jgi:hypothetical protein
MRNPVFRVAVLSAVLWLGCCLSKASAQYPTSGPSSVSPPPVSPYINITRRGADPGVNYYGIVRPQIDTRSSIQGLQQQVQSINNDVQQGNQPTALPTTGHAVQFQNLSTYFGRPLSSGQGFRNIVSATNPSAGVRTGANAATYTVPPARTR